LRVLVLSWLGAIAACLGYGVSSVLQSVAAKRSAEVVGLTGIVLIIKQLPYLLGLAAERMGEHVHEPRVSMRTGDTSATERRRIQTRPPEQKRSRPSTSSTPICCARKACSK
jgi:hypothetical protein